MRSKSLMTSQICLSSNDALRQWNLKKWYQSHVRLKIILYRTEIPIKKQLSIDNNIISIKVTTGNAPNKLKAINNTVEDAYAISEENSDEQGTVNKINVLPNQTNLTPITIMVVDTISAVKSRRLLKVLLDSGSTTTVINKKCLPKNCKTRKTSKGRMVNTLAGSYNTSEMVVMRNLRFPELDKNHNIDQQKTL